MIIVTHENKLINFDRVIDTGVEEITTVRYVWHNNTDELIKSESDDLLSQGFIANPDNDDIQSHNGNGYQFIKSEFGVYWFIDIENNRQGHLFITKEKDIADCLLACLLMDYADGQTVCNLNIHFDAIQKSDVMKEKITLQLVSAASVSGHQNRQRSKQNTKQE